MIPRYYLPRCLYCSRPLFEVESNTSAMTELCCPLHGKVLSMIWSTADLEKEREDKP